MYMLTNAVRSITRSIGRYVLIGIIVLIIAASACIGLSIQRAADKAKDNGLDDMTITAQISMDIRSMMENVQNPESGFNREDFRGKFESIQNIGTEELQTYAQAECVSDFYYTATIAMNGDGVFEAVSNTFETTTTAQDGAEPDRMPQMPGDAQGGRGEMMGSSSDFSIIGYSSDRAMTSFVEGSASISDGAMFEEGTSDLSCVISTELATYNNLLVGDTVTVVNPDDETETYVLTVVGTYDSSDSGNTIFGGGRGSFGASDPINQIYMSAAAVQAIVDRSVALSEDTALSATTAGTYVFADIASYELFEEQARALGMPEEYSVSSSDITAFEQQLIPLETLSVFAEYFLMILLAIGAVILVVLNLFNMRERKYEVGVLTAIGMKKWKVAVQFVSETLIVTVIAVLLGGVLGAVTAVPVSNALLEQQVESQQLSADRQTQSFGRQDIGSVQLPPDGDMDAPSGMPGNMKEMFGQFKGAATEYITEIHGSVDWIVIVQLLGIGLLLCVAASLVSVVFIMRYDPLKILANRD